MSTSTPVVLGARAGGVSLRTVLGLFKLRIATLIMITALGGLAIVPAGTVTPAQVLVLALSVFVASAAAGAFNQYAEADADRLMARTRTRAFASGVLRRRPAWLLLFGALLAAAVASAAWVVNGVSASYILAGALTYGGVYTLLLKRRTWLNIVIGGLSGSFAVLAGAAAADAQLGPLPLLLALVLFLWTPPHFWSLAIAGRADYAAAGVPMLPVVVGEQRAARIVHASTLALVVSTLLLPLFGAGPVVLAGALAGGLHFLRKTQALARRPGRQTALAAFFASMVQLSVLLAALAVEAALR